MTVPSYALKGSRISYILYISYASHGGAGL